MSTIPAAPVTAADPPRASAPPPDAPLPLIWAAADAEAARRRRPAG